MTKQIKIITVVCAVLTVLMLIFIFSNSLKSGEESYEQSKGLVAFVESILDPHDRIPTEKFNYAVRKAAHFLEFALLGLSVGGLVAFANFTKSRYEYFAPLFWGLLVAVIDEFIQSFMGRTSSVSDVLIDFCGVIVGISISILIFKSVKARINAHTNNTKIII